MYKAALALLVGLMLSVSGSAWGATTFKDGVISSDNVVEKSGLVTSGPKAGESTPVKSWEAPNLDALFGSLVDKAAKSTPNNLFEFIEENKAFLASSLIAKVSVFGAFTDNRSEITKYIGFVTADSVFLSNRWRPLGFKIKYGVVYGELEDKNKSQNIRRRPSDPHSQRFSVFTIVNTA